MSMDIYSKPGTKIVFTGENGSDWDKEHAFKHLEVGKEYTVKSIEVGGWSSLLELEEVPGVRFNTVHFIEPASMKYEEGAKVKFTGHGGSEMQLIEATTLLKGGEVYTVNFHYKSFGPAGQLDHIFLDGIPGIGFFAGMFEAA